MTKAQARAFKRRWRRVNQFEREELRRTPLDMKFRQLAALMASVKQLGWNHVLTEGEEEVRNRWNCLRKAYGV